MNEIEKAVLWSRHPMLRAIMSDAPAEEFATSRTLDKSLHQFAKNMGPSWRSALAAGLGSRVKCKGCGRHHDAGLERCPGCGTYLPGHEKASLCRNCASPLGKGIEAPDPGWEDQWHLPLRLGARVYVLGQGPGVIVGADQVMPTIRLDSGNTVRVPVENLVSTEEHTEDMPGGEQGSYSGHPDVHSGSTGGRSPLRVPADQSAPRGSVRNQSLPGRGAPAVNNTAALAAVFAAPGGMMSLSKLIKPVSNLQTFKKFESTEPPSRSAWTSYLAKRAKNFAPGQRVKHTRSGRVGTVREKCGSDVGCLVQFSRADGGESWSLHKDSELEIA